MRSSEDHSEEKTWVERSKKDIKSFQYLYEKYFDRVFRYILRRTDNEELTADLTSQTFYKALRSIRSYTWQGKPFIAWLYTIAGNEIRKHFRKSEREIFLVESDKLVFTEESENWPVLYQNKLEKALKTLSEEELQLLEFKYLEGYTFKEIGLILDVGESSVKMKTYRLIDKIKGIIHIDNDKA